MKKFIIFILGVITGVVLTIAVAAWLGTSSEVNHDRSFFDKPGEVMPMTSFKVFQVLDDGTALAHTYDKYEHDPIVLLMNKNGEAYYDDLIVKAPAGKCFRQVGTFKYTNNMGARATVPIVAIADK